MSAKRYLASIALRLSEVLGRQPSYEASQGRVEPLSEFRVWAIRAGETEALTGTRLRNLYGEFCLYTDSDPLSEARFFKQLRAAGIERYREGGSQRRWLYRVTFPKLREVQSDAA